MGAGIERGRDLLSAGARYLHCGNCGDDESMAVLVDTEGLHVVCETCETEHARVTDGVDLDVLVRETIESPCATCGHHGDGDGHQGSAGPAEEPPPTESRVIQ